MKHGLPRVQGTHCSILHPDGSEQTIVVGSPEWYRWLADPQIRSFVFANDGGAFTARKERKQRGGCYWVAYRRLKGRLFKVYLGRSEELTLARFHEAAATLATRGGEGAGQVSGTSAVWSQQPDHGTQASLLRTKLSVPPLRPGLVPRPQLYARLYACLAVPLTLMAAPAGSGKTTLLASWAAFVRQEGSNLELEKPSLPPSRIKTQSPQIAWLSLDQRDDDPTIFLRYLIAAL